MSRRCPEIQERGEAITDNRYARTVAAKLVAQLPDLPQPWDIEELCRALERARGRPLTLHAVNIPAFPFGMWRYDGKIDTIFYRSWATGYYRDHTILHEICHMLAGHGTGIQATATDPGPANPDLSRMKSRVFSAFEEEVAETFSTMVLKIAGSVQPKEVSAVEFRAQELLGAPYA